MITVGHLMIALLIYGAVRAVLRGKKPDPMAGRLIPRPYALDMDAMKAEGTRQQRERDEFNQRVWDARVADGERACAALKAKLEKSHQAWIDACQREDARRLREQRHQHTQVQL